ncbi:MAG: YihY/virulence factor BrkB family protein [Armatimonadota bacterium]|nr:YihY/virulence factor BrkB family protein [Armatimonadota bacterium]
MLRITYLRFGFEAGTLRAAAIAFFALVYLGPLGILLVSAAQLLLGGSEEVRTHIEDALAALGPDAAAIVMPHVMDLLASPRAHVAGVVSFIVLVWAGMHLFEAVERTLTGLWPGKVLRSYLGRKLVALIMMLVAGLLLGGFALFSAVLAAAGGWLQRFSSIDPTVLERLAPPFLLAYGVIMSCAAFAILYKFIPVQRVPTRAALVAGVFAAILWHAASPIFTWVLRTSHRQGAIYGGLADIVVFCFWAFLGAQILVLGGHFAVAYEHVFASRRPPEEDDELIPWPGGRWRED